MKHVELGLTLKGITSSKKVIEKMNKLGHCCSYNIIEELGTEATLFAASKKTVCLFGVKLRFDLFTSVVFDNFDRYVNTSDGSNTLQDTVGILVQNKYRRREDGGSDCNDIDSDDDDDTTEITYSRPKKMRRKTGCVAPEISEYIKRPILNETLLSIHHPLRTVTVPDLDFYKKIDLMWVMSHFFEVEKTSMWVGFNCKTIKDNSPLQKVFYLAPINKSPTTPDVVYETLRQTQQIATECGQASIMVTYDLAIAIIAMRLRSTEKPTFDNVFINCGKFHIQMAFFHAIGIFINDCGSTNVLSDIEILASGSVNGFVSGKHFNRCKRIHPMDALGLQILHFEKFLKQRETVLEDSDLERLKLC